ncbi:hypothetical protein Pmani_034361 [Petrolisthes manimaculis]|uniref:Uncharacterized protein n=1 Tax=Petrolisthes manimaculis TaxID=1843537 RepID=A0AAE1NPH9_9EUCA|nr:hypothetical protein Pmani_034361 [Petrolisthes manimaculis]
MPKRKFREQWLQEENFRGWLRKVDGDDYSAFCNVCKSTLVTEVSTLKRHSSSRRHTEGLARQTAAPAAQPPPRDGDDDSVTRAEIKLTAFLAEHNVSINTVDHLTSLLKDIFPDSNIASELSLKRTKATRILGNIGKLPKLENGTRLK